ALSRPARSPLPPSTLLPSTTLFRSRKLEIRPTDDRKSFRVEYRDNGTFSFKVTLQYAWVATGAGVIEVSATGQRTASQRNAVIRSEEHTSALQSRENVVCRHALENK